jgi:hypothetical protein
VQNIKLNETISLNPQFNSNTIYFYYPDADIGDSIPESEGRYVPSRPGKYVWTVKTYGILKSHGFDCVLTTLIPPAGVIITHRECLPDHIKPNPSQLFVCVVADTHRHPFAQIHLVQNPGDALLKKPTPLWPAAFMPHWTESGLRPRDPARGTKLTNVAYFGLETRLAPQLRSANFSRLMKHRGFEFRIIEPARWHDYSDIDAVLAVRSFAAVPFYKHPATKLYNTWLAGVPALLGHESAFQTERRSAHDYFEVGSIDQIIETLERLRGDSALRTAIEQNCAQRAPLVSPENIARHWITFCEEIAISALAGWQANSPAQMRHFFRKRAISFFGFQISDFFYRMQIMLRKFSMRLLP